MENDKIYVRFLKEHKEKYLKGAEELYGFCYKVDTDHVLKSFSDNGLDTISQYLFDKYGFEFVRAVKKLLTY